MKKFLILITLITFSCSKGEDSTSTPPPTQVTPETWGGWSPNFISQVANFTQERTSNKGNKEARTITVSKQTSITETNERFTQQDFNADGDLIDYINLIEDTYTASNVLGVRVDSSFVLSLNQDLNFLTRNFGLWAGGTSITTPFVQIWGSIWLNAGEQFDISPPPYLGWDVKDTGIIPYSSANDGGCWTEVESLLTHDSISIQENTLTRFTSTMNGVPVGEVLTESNAAALIAIDISKVDIMSTYKIVEELNTDGNLQSYNDITIGVYATGSTSSVYFIVGYLEYYGFLDAATFTCPTSSGKSISKKMFDYIKSDFELNKNIINKK